MVQYKKKETLPTGKSNRTQEILATQEKQRTHAERENKSRCDLGTSGTTHKHDTRNAKARS